MWKGNMFLKILVLCCLLTKVAALSNDFLTNFNCRGGEYESSQKCEITRISSTNKLQELFQKVDNYDYRYAGLNEHRYEFSYHYEFKFKDSSFEKFPAGNYYQFSHVLSIISKNVGLSALSRDSFVSFTSLEVLDLSHNKIQYLESKVLSNVISLRSFNVSHNQIEILNKDVFDEIGQNLTEVDLSYNQIKTFDSRIFESLGKINQINLYLGFNDIEEVSILPTSDIKFKLLDLHHNKLKSFVFNCKMMNSIIITVYAEVINEFSCKIDQLNLRNNHLITIQSFNVSSIDISENIELKNITLKFDALRKLVASNVSSKAVNYDFLQNAHQLTELDLSNTILGTPKIETFSEMTQLEVIKLRNTGLSQIEHGMFGNQVNIKKFDLSFNNLGFIDIEMLAYMKSLESFDISGNNLTFFNDANELRKYFQNLTSIRIENNNWNCSYLAKIVKAFDESPISIQQPANPVKNSSHVKGIKCKSISQNKPINSNNENDSVAQKLNEIIEKLNNQNISIIFLNVLTALITTILLVIGVLFGYLKLKNMFYRRFEAPCVLARSTNGSNMTVEIPLDSRKY